LEAKVQIYLLLANNQLIKTIPIISLPLRGPGESEWLVEQVGEVGLPQCTRIAPSRYDIPHYVAAVDMNINHSLAGTFS